MGTSGRSEDVDLGCAVRVESSVLMKGTARLLLGVREGEEEGGETKGGRAGEADYREKERERV